MTAVVVLSPAELAAMLEGAAERAARKVLDEHGAGVEWIDQDAVAKMLGCARSSVPTKCSRDGLPHSRVGRVYRFRRTDVEQWLAQQGPSDPRQAHGLRAIAGGKNGKG